MRASAAGERTGRAAKKKAATTVEKIFRNFIKGLTRSFVKRRQQRKASIVNK
jgi:hypothetical protein